MQPARINPSRSNSALNVKSLARVILANKAARMPAAIAGLAATAFLVGALLPSGQKAAQSRPADQNSKVANRSAQDAGKNSVTSAVKPASSTSTARRGVEFYTGDVRASMFSEPVAPAPPEPRSIAAVKPVRPAPIDPFADWNYTGTATIGDDKIAILENVDTHDGVLLHVGDKFLGTKVSDISGSLLTFGKGATSKSLFVSMNTSYIPLSASASFLTAKPEKPANPGDLQAKLLSLMVGKGATAATMGGPSVTLPNGKVLSGTALDRYNRRLNRGWNSNNANSGR